MLHHVSFAADRPRQVADILARLVSGRVTAFGPWPGGYIVWSNDAAGTAIEIYPQGTELSPDPTGGEARFSHNYFAQRGTASHAAISVDRSEDEITALARECGWQAATLDRGGFDVVEFWVENRVMLEVMTPVMLAQYLRLVQAPQIAAGGADVNPLTLSVRVPTDPRTAWRAWTDAAELRSWWQLPAARIDLRVGGAYELIFLPEAASGQRGSESCRILSYVPDRMLSFSWNTPPHLSVPPTHTWVVLTFTEAADGTDVELVHNGLLTGPEWDECREYFRQAWRRVLHRMVDHWESVKDLTALSDVVSQPPVDVSQIE